MARVTVEDCVDKIKNRFELVVLATQRTKGIASGDSLTVDRDKDKNPVVALREIALGNISIPHLREELTTSLQARNKIDTIEDENLFAEAQEIIEENDYSLAGTDLFVGDSHSDLENDHIFTDNIIEEDIKK